MLRGRVAGTTLTVSVPADLLSNLWAGDQLRLWVQSVTNPPPGTLYSDLTAQTTSDTMSAAAAAGSFTNQVVPPVVTGVTPAYALRAGGTAITVFGQHLAGGTVALGAAGAGTVTTPGDTSMTFSAPSWSGSGPVDVTVATSAGTSPDHPGRPGDLRRRRRADWHGHRHRAQPAGRAVVQVCGDTTGATCPTVTTNGSGTSPSTCPPGVTP